MDAAGSEIDLDLALGLQVLRIELDLVILLLPSGFHQERIAEVLVMQMKRRPIVSVPVGRDRLTVGNSRIFDQDLDVGTALSVRPAHESFDRKPMVRLVGGVQDLGKQEERHGSGDERPPPGA